LAGFFIGLNAFATFAANALRVAKVQDLLKTISGVGKIDSPK
jgi:hypothetical protein